MTDDILESEISRTEETRRFLLIMNQIWWPRDDKDKQEKNRRIEWRKAIFFGRKQKLSFNCQSCDRLAKNYN